MPALLDRLRPLPTPEDAAALAAMQADRARSSRAWLLAGVVGAHAAFSALFGALDRPTLPIAIGVALLAIALLGMGVAQSVLLVRAEPSRRGAQLGIGILVALGLAAAPVGGLLLMLVGMPLLMLPLAMAAVAIALIVRGIRRPWLRGAPGATLLGLAAVLAATALVAIDGLVLMPTTLMPDLPLGEAYALLAASGEDHGIAWIVNVSAAWAVASALLAVGLWMAGVEGGVALGWMLAAGAAVLVARPVAEFGLGMSIGDVGYSGGMSIADAPLWLLTTALAAAASWLLLGSPRDRDVPEALPADRA